MLGNKSTILTQLLLFENLSLIWSNNSKILNDTVDFALVAYYIYWPQPSKHSNKLDYLLLSSENYFSLSISRPWQFLPSSLFLWFYLYINTYFFWILGTAHIFCRYLVSVWFFHLWKNFATVYKNYDYFSFKKLVLKKSIASTA